MSTTTRYCDLCSRYVDTNVEGEGTFDDVAGIYSCERCNVEWEALVMRGELPKRSTEVTP